MEELEIIAKHTRDGRFLADNSTIVITDEGMSEATCRAMSDRKMTAGVIVDLSTEVKLPAPLNDEDEKRALKNLDYCVVGLVEMWKDSQRVIEHFFPWIDFQNDHTRQKLKLFEGKETQDSLRVDLKAALMRQNQCDFRLYEKMLSKFQHELTVTRHFLS